MANYNYLEAMKEDIKNYIDDYIDTTDYRDREELEEKLNECCWIEDSITGNASGSYTFHRATAKEYVMGNLDLLKAVYEEFDMKERFADDFFSENFEYMDVSIRCYLLGCAISELLDSIEDSIEFGEIPLF